MSLTIYVIGENDSNIQLPIVHDVEIQFFKTRLYKNDYNMKALKEIEKATYNDEFSFIDRFGFKLYTDDMSTGCKAAICVNAFPDIVINTIECGTNALEFIISNCSDGYILMSREAMIFSVDTPIDVIIDDRHFDKCDDLLEYIDERY